MLILIALLLRTEYSCEWIQFCFKFMLWSRYDSPDFGQEALIYPSRLITVFKNVARAELLINILIFS